jgi:hypothetical protein
MPVYRREPKAAGPERVKLVEELVAELRTPKAFGQPIILEDRTPETRSVRVQVIWDRWREIASDLRAAVITEAYQAVYGTETAKQITLSLGLTLAEAIGMGLLPFQVQPARKKDDPITGDQYRAAMQDLGAFLLPGSDAPQLRFADYDDAQTAHDALEKLLPNSHWIITQEIYSPDDLAHAGWE